MTLDEKLVQIIPSERQLAFQQLEFYCFVHFSVNTFTDREWGDGTESPSIFDPKLLNAEQWITSIKSAGMRGLILTCKHHDGFCLWPSKFTKHTVAYSPYKNGMGDIVKEVSDACRKHDINFGIYLSPWDRNCALYGQGELYDDYFINQLTELLTGYGKIFSVWFDGACGEGPNGKKQYYNWKRYYALIRQLQPDACINVCGPDIRWCGNEAGHTRNAEWSVVPERTKDSEIIAENSQQTDSNEFRQRKIDARDEDLGSRERLKNEDDLIWYPAEVNTSIRPGWFWHKSEDDKVRPLDELICIYNNSVGGNATFLLNIPPTTDGLFHPNDVERLKEIGDYLSAAFAKNILDTAKITVDSCDDASDISYLLKDSYDEFFTTPKGIYTAEITINWDDLVDIGNIVIKENIRCSQRIEKFSVEAYIDGEFKEIYRGTVIGYKRIIPLNLLKTSSIKLKIKDSRTEPTISFLGIYKSIKK